MALLPKPEVGLVLHYSFLWAAEAEEGREEAVKEHPVVLYALEQFSDGSRTAHIAYVAPITHSAPRVAKTAIKLPDQVKPAMGLDPMEQWLCFGEVNKFRWAGYDLHPRPSTDSYIYGKAPAKLITFLRQYTVSAIEIDRD